MQLVALHETEKAFVVAVVMRRWSDSSRRKIFAESALVCIFPLPMSRKRYKSAIFHVGTFGNMAFELAPELYFF